MKKLFNTIICLAVLVCTFAFCNTEVKAQSSYLSAKDAKYFICFVYNANADVVTDSVLQNDAFYNLLVGNLKSNPTVELATKAAFLSFLDARIDYTLSKAGIAINNSRDYMLKYFNNALEDESCALVKGIFKDTIATSVLTLCGTEDILPIVDGLEDPCENPTKYLDEVKLIASTLTYAYGQNVTSLYRYFDAALSCVYLKSTPGAYEMAMSANITILKNSNFMAYASLLIPGVESWETWISKMDEWAQFVYDMKNDVASGNSSGSTEDTYVVVFHPNCEELDAKINWYASGTIKAPVMEREGYILQGWYFDEECTRPVSNDYVVTENITVFAKWLERYVQITFDTNCPDMEDVSYTYDRLEDNWYEPEMFRHGYDFAGWYYDAACTNAVGDTFVFDDDITFYAKWEFLYYYKVTNGKAQLTGIKKWQTYKNGIPIYDIVIPMYADSYPVTSIKLNAGSRSITSVTFPDSFESINEWAFSDYITLRKVTLGKNVKVIEEGAFNLCYNLETVVFNDKLEEIHDSAFRSCSKLSNIEFPESLRTIGNSFGGCDSITEFIIPEGVTSVSDDAFSSMRYLEKISIGKNITNISGETFLYSSNLAEIIISPDHPTLKTIDNVLYTKDGKTLLYCPCANKTKDITVPAGVEKISDNAFYYSNYVENVVMPQSVKELGESVFSYCCALKTVTLPEGLSEIPYNTFYYCENLEKVNIPQNVKNIGYGAFDGCKNLEEINVPETCENIESFAFSGCEKIKSIYIPTQMTTLPDGILFNCKSLEKIEIPSGVTYIGYSALQGCEKLTEIIIPDTVTQIMNSAFNSCTNIKSIKIPSKVEYLDGNTFGYCTNLEYVVLPAGIKTFGYSEFYGCEELEDIYFMGSKQDWDSIEVADWGNEILDDIKIHYNATVAGKVEKPKLSDGKISGKVKLDLVGNTKSVVVAVYEGSKFVTLKTVQIPDGSDEVDFEFCDMPYSDIYYVKVFFCTLSDMLPMANFAFAGISTK